MENKVTITIDGVTHTSKKSEKTGVYDDCKICSLYERCNTPQMVSGLCILFGCRESHFEIEQKKSSNKERKCEGCKWGSNIVVGRRVGWDKEQRCQLSSCASSIEEAYNSCNGIYFEAKDGE